MPKKNINKLILAIALLPLLLLSTQAFAQTTSLGGTVMDASQAVLPGATVTATNSQTGVVTTTVANNAGVYNFPSLQPGVYKVTAVMKGFQDANKTDVKLGMGSQIRLNFELVVAGSNIELSVTTTASDLLLEQGSSTGTVLPENMVSQLPLASNDVMDLINVMGGVVKSENPIFNNYEQSFAGVPAANINIQRDGITVNEVRYNSGIVSPSRVNQEMVGEFKMVLSPVDAEMGRGAGQVQILTKSGANAFHGSGVWNVQNTALDANEFYNNAQKVRVVPAWRNLNNYTLSLSGPIIKNKTFFFATWDQQIVRSKSSTNPRVLTDCARKGIYRYWPGYYNGNVNQAVTGQYRPSVAGADGYPITADGTRTTEGLAYESVLGQLTDTARAQIAEDPVNCSAFNFSASNTGVVAGSAWDTYRNDYDQSGFIDRFTALMPTANSWEVGDGLNVAGHRWTRVLKGSDTVFGSGEDNLRKSITVKVDHNINSSHRASGTYTYETDYGEDAYAQWPNGYGGAVDRQPQSFMLTITSTLKPTLLNEFRFGLSRTRTHTNEPFRNPSTGEKMKQIIMDLMPTTADKFPNYTNEPLLIGPGQGSMLFATDTFSTYTFDSSHIYGSRGNLPATWGGVDPRWTFSDNITWTRGAHSFKGGVDVRLAKSWQESNGTAGFFDSGNTFPSVTGGVFSRSGWANGTFTKSATNFQNMMGSDYGAYSSGNYNNVYGLLAYMSGSVGNVIQYFYIAQDKGSSTYRWNAPGAGELNYITDLRNRELSAFFKDEWKVSSSLSLNLGVRYEYYGIPWVDSGMTAALKGGTNSMFGVSGGDWNTWMPGNPVQLGNEYLTQYEFVGPNSPNSGKQPWNKDSNNFGPHIGFAWQLPWFGKGKTTMRGGYSVSYSQISNFDGFAGIIAKVPGTTYTYKYTGDVDHTYVNLSNLGDVVPLQGRIPESIQPMNARQLTDRADGVTVYDQNIKNPYIQNLNLSITRNIGSNLKVDVRYIGTLSRKTIGGVNLNTVNYVNNGLLEELKTVRAGGQSTLLNTWLGGRLCMWYESCGPTGSDQLRVKQSTNLATGNMSGVASYLATTNGNLSVASGINGAVLRAAGVQENFIYTNPQFSSATINGNINHSNYHSLQAQVELRPTRGIMFQTTYTWSRNMGMSGAADPFDRAEDYRLSGSHRSHSLTSIGTFDLPMGANGFIFRNSTGILKKAVEGWQLSWIASLTSGIPGSIGAATRLWGASNPDIVRPDLWDNKSGHVTWEPGAGNGLYWGDKYTRVYDPQCDAVEGGPNGTDAPVSNLYSTCRGSSGLRALALAETGEIIFQNPEVGKRGNYAPMSITGPGRWELNMAMGKAIEFMEGKRIDFRVDAQNIFNHATPSNGISVWNARFTQINNPQFGMNTTTEPFGYLSTKGGHRTFQARLRISF